MFEFTGGGAAVLDFDGDLWPDVYLTQGCSWPPDPDQQQYRDRLFRNLGDGRFEDVTREAGLGDNRFSQGVQVGDFDNDGFADIYLANVGANRLYRNNGDGTFDDVAVQAAIGGEYWTTSCLMADLNGDGLADLYEVNLDGEVVWEWHAHNHIDLNLFSPATPEGDWLHVNSVAPLPENKWYDAGDERFRPGNILLNARNINVVYIIDKETKQIVWEGTHNYKGGMAHAHEAEMIGKGLPGAGNIILFDNGLFTRNRTHTGQTFIVELDPTTQEIVWIYETDGYANLKFFSKSMGTQQRLPNGNTYIAEDNTGRLFQVRPDGEIVWEYVNRGGTTRPSVIPYDFTPQLRAMPRPEELAVTPPNNLEWRLTPDTRREGGRL